MKKNTCIALAITVMALQMRSQFAHFEHRSNPPVWPGFDATWEISAGTRVNAPTAALAGVYRPGAIPSGNTNFFIMETAIPATVLSSWSGRAYKLFLPGAGCSASTNQLTNSSGITPVEIRQLSTPVPQCAMVGAAVEGCFFGMFDRALNTNPMSSATFFEFPAPASKQPSRPLMAQSNDPNNYEFFIAGEYDQNMYMIKVDDTGKPLWSVIYKANSPGSPLEFYPKAMIMDPFQPNIVTVVGQALTATSKYDGFLMYVDAASGAVQKFYSFDQQSTDDKFNSIAEATSPNGYIIGGATNLQGSAGDPWVLKFDQNLNAKFVETVKSNHDASANGMLEILERNNTITPGIEYYGLFESQSKTTIAKLDVNGAPFHVPYPTVNSEFPYNTFWYGGVAPYPVKPVGMYLDNGPQFGMTTGLNIYATFYLGPYNQLNLVSSFFNGESTCNTPINLPPISQTGLSISQYGVQSSPGLNYCQQISINPVVHNTNNAYTCVNIYNTTGNNLKTAEGATGIEEFANGQVFKAYPNPASDQFMVSCLVADNTPVKIELFNMLGELIYWEEKQVAEAGAYKAEINLNSLGIETGMYLLVAKVGSEKHEQKVMVTK